MQMSRRIVCWLLVFGVLVSSHSANAQEATGPRVRPGARGINELLADATRRSPTVRALIEQLEQANLIVYVMPRPFAPGTLAGQLTFVTATEEWRFVLVEIGCTQSWDTQVATLGHELQHAVEISDASWVRSSEDVAAFYRHAGTLASYTPGHEAFESNAAMDAGRQVMRELRAQ